MRTRARPFAAFAAIVVIVMGCSPSASPGPSTGASVSPPDEETTLILAQQSDPGILNNIVANTLGSYYVHHNVWSELVQLSYDQQSIVPELAESWDISADGLEVTFHLRENVTWHDGEPFTANDVKFTIDEAIALPTWGIQYLQAVDSVRVDDDHTVTFILKEPNASWLTLFAFGSNWGLNIMPQHLYEGTDISENPLNQEPIGTGPYKFVEHVAGQSITLEANPDFWDGEPPADRVVIRIIPETATALQELQAGNVHFLNTVDNPVEFAQLPPIAESETITTSAPTGGVIIWFLFNTTDEVLSDPALRQAIGMAVDRTEIAELGYHGFASPMNGFYLEGNWYNSDAELPYDPEAAMELLDDLGYTADGNGERMTIEFAYHPLFGMDVTAEVVKEQLAQVGINLELWSGDYPTWFEKVHTNGDYSLALRASQIGPDPDLMWPWLDPLHEGESGSTYYDNPEMNDLFSEARQATDDDQRFDMYAQIQEILAEDIPVLPLVNIQDVNLWRHDLVSNLGPELNTLRWDISKAVVRAAP